MMTNGKRMTFVISDRARGELTAMSSRYRRSMTELIRLGLGVIKIVLEAAESGSHVVVTDADGNARKEIVLPQ